MARPTKIGPTDGELLILKVLWRRGGSTVRQIYNELKKTRQVGYTSVLKLVQVMTVKGLVERDKGERPQVYYAALSERRTKRGLIRDFIERVFSGSAKDLIAHALGAKKSTPSELTEIRKLLDKLE